MPGATETDFFETAEMLDTKVGQAEKAEPADVARQGYRAMMAGRSMIIHGLKNKLSIQSLRVSPRSIARKVAASLNTVSRKALPTR
jgi:short-subunit dehydrogenase